MVVQPRKLIRHNSSSAGRKIVTPLTKYDKLMAACPRKAW